MHHLICRSLFNTFIAFCVFFASVFTPYYGVKKAFAVLPVLGYAVGLVMANKTTALTVAGLTALVGATVYGLTSQVKDEQGNVYADDIITTATSPEAMEAMYNAGKVNVSAPATSTAADDGKLGITRGYQLIGESLHSKIYDGVGNNQGHPISFDQTREMASFYGKDPKDACQKYADKLTEKANADLLKDGSLLEEIINKSEAYRYICQTCDLVDPRDRDSITKYFDGDIDLKKVIGGFYDCVLKGKRNDESGWNSRLNIAIKLFSEGLKCADGYIPSYKEGDENTCILDDATEVVSDNKVNSKFDESDNSNGYKSNDKDKLAGKTSTSFEKDGGVTISVGGDGSYKQMQGTTSDGKSINGYDLEKPEQVVNITPEYETVCPNDNYCYTKKIGDTMTVYEMQGKNEFLVGTVYMDENGVIRNVEIDSQAGYLAYEESGDKKTLAVYEIYDGVPEMQDVILTPNGYEIYSPAPVTNYNFPTNSGSTGGSTGGSSGSVVNSVSWISGGGTSTGGGSESSGGNTESGSGTTTGGGSESSGGNTESGSGTTTGGGTQPGGNTESGSGTTTGDNTQTGGNTESGGSTSPDSGNQPGTGTGENPTPGEQGSQGENQGQEGEQSQSGDDKEPTFPNDYALRVDVHETTAAVNNLNNTAKSINDNLSKLTKEIEPPEPPDVNMDKTMGDYGKEFIDLLSWKLPPHRSECPSPEFELFGRLHNFDDACYLWEQNRDLISSIMNLFWVVSGLFIVLRS